MSERLPTPPALIGLAVGLALFYWGDALPLAPLPQLLGLAVFVELAFLRPDLALLFVPLTAPLYLIPAALPGLRAEPLRLPLHEVALLATLAATVARWAWERRRPTTDERRTTNDERSLVRRYLPHALLLLSGIVGVLLAVPEGRGAALREFRWLIVEPLIFYALLRRSFDERRTTNDARRRRSRRSRVRRTTTSRRTSVVGRWSLVVGQWPAAGAFILGGVLVAALGLLQFAGLDLVPLLGEKQSFSENVVAAGAARRVASVYGHPNNLGLYLGRVWPLAAALALLRRTTNDERRTTNDSPHSPTNGWSLVIGRWSLVFDRWSLGFGLASFVCLAGILVSFSRGAWLGAVAAAGVLALGLTIDDRQPTTDERQTATDDRRPATGLRPVVGGRWSVVGGLSSVVVLAAMAGLALTVRGGLGGGSADARVLLWREAVELIRTHPLGLGLDQFYYYHNPEFGRSIIDPALVGTSEQYASHPHNLVLDAWLNLGPLGLAALAWLTARGFRAGARALRRGPNPLALGVLAAMAAALVHGVVDVFYFVEDLAIVFWLLLALAEREETRNEG
jgi:hypothetical protein